MPAAEATSTDCMRAAFQAVLRGDYAERDRLLDRARALISAEGQAAAMERVLAVDFYATRGGTIIPTKLMAARAGALQ